MTLDYYDSSGLEHHVRKADLSRKTKIYFLAGKFIAYYLDHGLAEIPFSSPAVFVSAGSSVARMRLFLTLPRFYNTICWALQERVSVPVTYTLALQREKRGGLIIVEPHRQTASHLEDRKRYLDHWGEE